MLFLAKLAYDLNQNIMIDFSEMTTQIILHYTVCKELGNMRIIQPYNIFLILVIP